MEFDKRYGRNIEEISPFESTVSWRGGAVAGLIATAATGVAITAIDVDMLTVMIAGMYGLEGVLLAGWVAHLVHGTLFGVAFAVVLSDPSLVGITERTWKSIVVGLVYGLVLAVIATGIILPVWLQSVGVSTVPSIPFVTTASLGWHALYGIVLGALLPFLDGL